MDELTLQIGLVTGIIGIVALIIVGLLRLKLTVDKSKGTIKVEAMESQPSRPIDTTKVLAALPLIVRECIETGIERAHLETTDLLEDEIAMAKEHLSVLREGLIDAFIKTAEACPEDDSEDVRIILGNIAIFFIQSLESIFMFSFMRNNWKKMSQADFVDMIASKNNVIRTDYQRVLSVYFQSRRHEKLLDELKALIPQRKDQTSKLLFTTSTQEELNSLLDTTITTIFEKARKLKTSAEAKIEMLSDKLNAKIYSILLANDIIIPKTDLTNVISNGGDDNEVK